MNREFPHSTLEALLNGSALDEDLPFLRVLHASWQRNLSAGTFACDGRAYALVWLAAGVEAEIDEIWRESPSAGYLGNCLAQAMCMEAMQGLLGMKPGHCLPFPPATPELRKRAAAAGCRFTAAGLLERRYASLTLVDNCQTCEECAFKKDCRSKPSAGERAEDGVSK